MSSLLKYWIPAFAGMTKYELLYLVPARIMTMQAFCGITHRGRRIQ